MSGCCLSHRRLQTGGGTQCLQGRDKEGQSIVCHCCGLCCTAGRTARSGIERVTSGARHGVSAMFNRLNLIINPQTHTIIIYTRYIQYTQYIQYTRTKVSKYKAMYINPLQTLHKFHYKIIHYRKSNINYWLSCVFVTHTIKSLQS